MVHVIMNVSYVGIVKKYVGVLCDYRSAQFIVDNFPTKYVTAS